MLVQEVIDYINDNIITENICEYTISVQQYFENVFGGNIVINNNGEILVEFSEGTQGPIGNGSGTPKYFARKDDLDVGLKYSFDNLDLRKLIWNTVSNIPHQLLEDRMMDPILTPGYYEFVLIDPSFIKGQHKKTCD